MEPATRDELQQLLQHALDKAGNGSLVTDALMDTLVDHCAGNYRVLMTEAGELPETLEKAGRIRRTDGDWQSAEWRERAPFRVPCMDSGNGTALPLLGRPFPLPNRFTDSR
jgi:hypothetical protein